jgi:hypothetical protein
MSMGALFIEETSFNRYTRFRDYLRLVLCAILENFSYRQMIVVFRFMGFLRYKKYKHSWSHITRMGESPPEQAETNSSA